MKEYRDMVCSVHSAYRKELSKHEEQAKQEAVRVARMHGLSAEDAELFVRSLVESQKKSLQQKISWAY